MSAVWTVAALAALALVGLWALQQHGQETIEARIDALDISDADKLAALACFHDADSQKPLWRRLADQVRARLVLWPVVKALAWDANELPAKYAEWANNVGINGDGEAILQNGQWLTAGHDISWPEFNAAVAAGARRYLYADPDYEGDAYYSKGNRPRSAQARYDWLTRNVKSADSVAAGVDVAARPEVIAGSDPRIDGTPVVSTAQAGFMLLRAGSAYQLRCSDRWGPICIWRNVGFKLDTVRNSPEGTGRAAVVATWVSFKRWHG